MSQPVDAGVAGVVVALLCDQLARGWDVRLACPDGPLASRARELGVPTDLWTAERSPGCRTAAEVRRIADIVATVRPDICHLHSSKAGLAGRLALRGRVPTVFQPHAWSFDAVHGPLRLASREWERRAARWTDLLLCVSTDELHQGRRGGVSGRARVVPNGVDLERFAPGDRGRSRRELALGDGPIAVCVGRIVEQKGQDLLLDAWPRVLAQVPDASLVFVGDGPGARRLKERPNLAAGSVTWAGASEDPSRFYAAADVVVVPSRWEGMALVPLEAMACGRSVVAFEVGGARASIGDAGSVVPRGDVAGLATEVAHRLGDGVRADSEGQRGRVRAEADFDVRVAASRVSAQVEECLRLVGGRP